MRSIKINELHIPVVAEQCHCWLLYSANDTQFEEFVSNSYVALGWNEIDSSMMEEVRNGKWEEHTLLNRLEQVYYIPHPQQVLHNCMQFYTAVKCDDIVMLVGQTKAAFALLGDYYEAHEQEGGQPQKRRSAHFIKIVSPLESLHPMLCRMVETTKQEFQEMEPYKAMIFSTCFDIYMLGSDISVTYRVEKQQGIPALELAKFIDRTGRIIANSEANTIFVRTNLNSPGDIVLTIANGIGSVTGIILVYLCIVGGKYKEVEFYSLAKMIERIINRKHTMELLKLEIEAKKLENKNQKLRNQQLREEIRRLKLQNDREQRNMQETIEFRSSAKADIAYSQTIFMCHDIFEAAKVLQISRPSTDTIVFDMFEKP